MPSPPVQFLQAVLDGAAKIATLFAGTNYLDAEENVADALEALDTQAAAGAAALTDGGYAKRSTVDLAFAEIVAGGANLTFDGDLAGGSLAVGSVLVACGVRATTLFDGCTTVTADILLDGVTVFSAALDVLTGSGTADAEAHLDPAVFVELLNDSGAAKTLSVRVTSTVEDLDQLTVGSLTAWAIVA